MTGLLRSLRTELALAAGLFLVAGGVHATNLQLEKRQTVRAYDGTLGPLPDGKALRVIALGFDRLLADLFWLRTVNYLGDERNAEFGYPALAELGDLVTDIDPKFKTAYSVLNVTLNMLANDVDSAIALLDKGMQHLSWWKLHFLQGFNWFYYKEDNPRVFRINNLQLL